MRISDWSSDVCSSDLLLAGEIFQQRAVAAADIEHPAARRHMLGDQQQVAADVAVTGGGWHLRLRLGAHLWAPFRPRTSAQPSMKPLSVLNISGSSSRKASWPLSVSISTKLTLAAAALSARTISLFSGVGNSQSDVNETTQKRVFELLNTLASTPPAWLARSK